MTETQAALNVLDERTMDPDPIKQFRQWFEIALGSQLLLPEAMTLATATPGGKPSARMVLLKHVDERGFVFYTNYESRKGKELAANPVASLVFYWAELNRQVRVEGNVAKVSAEESDEYFSTRPRDSQLSSLTSAQSKIVTNREDLDRRFEDLKKQYEGKPIPRPSQWGGYRLKPVNIEFWQQRYARLNDRVLYERGSNGKWSVKRLAP